MTEDRTDGPAGAAGEETAHPGAETAGESPAAADAPPQEAAAETEADGAAAPDGTAAEVADLKDKLLRALAETENLRRRSQKDREDALKYGQANFARDMLGVADNLRRAIEAIPEDGALDGDRIRGFVEGVALTEKELQSALQRHGIEKIDPAGAKFDPQYHEALFEVPTSDAESGTVVQVVETGYVIHGRLLRPAKVGIAKALADPGETVDTVA